MIYSCQSSTRGTQLWFVQVSHPHLKFSPWENIPWAGNDPKGKFLYTAFGDCKKSLQSFQGCHLSLVQTEEEISLS